MILELNIMPHTKINSKKIMGSNVKHKITKILEKNIKEISQDLGLDRILGLDTKSMIHKRKS